MSERVTATEAARRFSDLLNRVRYAQETFVIVRGGEEVGVLGPVPPRRSVTLGAFVEKLRKATRPDEGFIEDLERIQAEQPPAGEGPWSY
jgi:prevent-host-death family protein